MKTGLVLRWPGTVEHLAHDTNTPSTPGRFIAAFCV